MTESYHRGEEEEEEEEEDRTVSELLREAIRLYMEEREWRRGMRYERFREREKE